MATFIPERLGLATTRNNRIKGVLDALDDRYVVRTPLRREAWEPEFFVHHPERGWLALAVREEPIAALDQGQLFDDAGRGEFERFLAAFRDLEGAQAAANRALGKLVLMWRCAPEELERVAGRYLERFGIRLLAKETFLKLGDGLIPRLLTPLAEEAGADLLQHYFPEAEIPPAYTVRRPWRRDNSARLPRLFLDSRQEWAAKLDLEQPEEQAAAAGDLSVRLINGVAGSGKTLIALSRALLLAERYPERRILLLSHNTPIVADLNRKVLRARGNLPRNLEIRTFADWATDQWGRIIGPRRPSNESAFRVEALIQRLRPRWPELRQSEAQLREELDFINDHLLVAEEQYLEANRTGRGFSLRPKERAQIWRLHQAVTEELGRAGKRLWSGVYREVCLADDHAKLERYHDILIDEAQFFAPSWFHALKLALTDGGRFFLCADPNQGFMKSRLSWKGVGLNVVGRTKKLHRSYRTTRAILAAAGRGEELAGGGDPEEYLSPDFEGMEAGERPILIYADAPQDAVDRVVNEVVALTTEGGLPLDSLLVVYGKRIGDQALYQQYCDRLESRKVWWLNRSEHKKRPPGSSAAEYLRLASLETATGLEAAVVFVVGVERLFHGVAATGTGEEESAEREESARKLYMAMTRAASRLVLISTERLPEGVEGLFLVEPEGEA